MVTLRSYPLAVAMTQPPISHQFTHVAETGQRHHEHSYRHPGKGCGYRIRHETTSLTVTGGVRSVPVRTGHEPYGVLVGGAMQANPVRLIGGNEPSDANALGCGT